MAKRALSSTTRTRRSRRAAGDNTAAQTADTAIASTAETTDVAGAADAVDTANDMDDISAAETGPSDDEIRTRAYHRYLERGGGHGQDFDDWLEAERELRQPKV
jgi:hypothetical protein